MGNEIEMQNEVIHELGDTIDHTTDTIQRDRMTLQRHSKKKHITHCGAYLFFTILILIVLIVILNILRNAFLSSLSLTNKLTHHTQSVLLQSTNHHQPIQCQCHLSPVLSALHTSNPCNTACTCRHFHLRQLFCWRSCRPCECRWRG